MQDGAQSDPARPECYTSTTVGGALTTALMTLKYSHGKSISTFTEAGYLGQRGAIGPVSFLK